MKRKQQQAPQSIAELPHELRRKHFMKINWRLGINPMITHVLQAPYHLRVGNKKRKHP